MNLPFPIVENGGKSRVHQIQLCLIEPERDREFKFFGRMMRDQQIVQLPIASQIDRVAVDRLLEIADHAEVPRPRRRLLIVPPDTGRFRWARDFKKNQELLRIGVLRLVQNHAIIFLADPPNDLWLLHQLCRQRHLVGIRDDASLEAEIAISLLHFGRDTKRARIHPITQWAESVAPAANEIPRGAGARWPRNEFIRFAPALFPALQFGLRLWNRARRLTLCDRRKNLREVGIRAGCVRLDRAEIDLAFARQLHQLARLHVAQQDAPIFFA